MICSQRGLRPQPNSLVVVVVLSLVVECPREGADEDERVWLRPKAALWTILFTSAGGSSRMKFRQLVAPELPVGPRVGHAPPTGDKSWIRGVWGRL